VSTADLLSPAQPLETLPPQEAAALYSQHAGAMSAPSKMSGIAKYKEDQLLRNPGGDHYDLETKQAAIDQENQKSFWGMIKKDVCDSFGNVKNLFHNVLLGSKILYRDESGEIREATQRGLVGAVRDFVKDLGSALTFGAWNPDGEAAPQGFKERVRFSFSKMKEAVLGDLVGGVTNSLNHVAKNAILAGWNLVEVVPDATIGSFDAGRKLTTTIFDDGQVVVEYLTDVLPSGDAWMRVHASKLTEAKLPVVYNLKMPEHYKEDVRWQYIRNTPFRKSIETIGALLADAAAIGAIEQTKFLTNDRHHEK
jgi:hypothetical protein